MSEEDGSGGSSSKRRGRVRRRLVGMLKKDYHDRINVLVEAPQSNNPEDDEEQKFIILEQTKYSLDTPSYAIIGGIIEPKEEATLAAKREVNEELNISCNNWISLGKYRTDVNRGMGYVSMVMHVM